QAAESFGIFNLLGVLTRAWSAWRRDPVSNQAIIDRGEAFLARALHAPDAPAVHARLADAYERAGNYERALLHYRATPDPDPKLLDGDHDNGELADAGVTLSPGQMRLTLYNTDQAGQHIETRSLTSETYERARAAAEEALYARLLTAERRNADTGRFERYIP